MNHINHLTAKYFFAIAIFLFFSAPTPSQDLQRGLRNYQAIMKGEKTLDQLSAQEKNEVILVYSRLQRGRSDDEKSPACEDARSRARSSALELSSYARRLRNCAESENFSDDCSSEFRRVKSSQSDYESAVADISSYCR